MKTLAALLILAALIRGLYAVYRARAREEQDMRDAEMAGRS